MTVFVDTSALYAVLDRSDANHLAARRLWQRLLPEGSILVTTNYVVLETSALVQSRLGVAALRTLHEDVVPALAVEFIDERRHKEGVSAVLSSARRKLSLVDCVSFAVMREAGLREVFCFDRHFAEQGFACRP